MGLDRIERRDAETVAAELELAFADLPAGADLRRLVDRLNMAAGEKPVITYMDIAEAVGRAWMMGARVALNTVQGRGPCRICGCWELEACEGGCAWAEPGLCTVCAGQER